MLLSLRNRLTIAICPDHVALIGTQRGWRPQSGKPVLIECAETTDEPAWQASLTAMRQAFKQLKIEPADVDVILSDRLTRYALIPWSSSVQKEVELAVVAQIHFETLYGNMAQQWKIQTDSQEYGCAGVGCALDRTLMTALHALLAEFGLRCVSLRPYFMHVMNRWRDQFALNAMISMVEAGQCVLVSLQNGTWHSIRTIKLMDADEQNFTVDLATLLNREILLQGLVKGTMIYLHTLVPIDLALLKQSLNVIPLQLPSTQIRQATAVNMLVGNVA